MRANLLHGNWLKQAPLQVFYQDTLVGDYFADMIVGDKMILELQATETIDPKHIVQLQNDLKASHIELGFIFNFDPQPKFERRVFKNNPAKNPRLSA